MPPLQGVGLIVIDDQERVLIVRELKDKPAIGKTAGMLSIPFESHDDELDNGSLIKTAVRAQREELGEVLCPQTQVSFVTTISYNHAVVKFLVIRVETEFVPKPEDTEDVTFAGWYTVDELLQLSPPACRIELPSAIKFVKMYVLSHVA